MSIIIGCEKWQVSSKGDLLVYKWHVVYDEPTEARTAFDKLRADVADKTVNKQQWAIRSNAKITEERTSRWPHYVVRAQLVYSPVPIEGFSVHVDRARAVQGFVIS